MNYLGHLFFSGKNEEIMVGNFIGDYVKGNVDKLDYSENIKKGISLHRKIDELTDSNQYFLETKRKYFSKYKLYSGILVDLFFDHYLSSNWENYNNQNLIDYTEKSYKIIYKYEDVLPVNFKKMFYYMSNDNWLYNYNTIKGIQRAIKGVSYRFKRKTNLEESINELNNNYDEIKILFQSFMNEMIVNLKRDF